jgi:hypothetical protein
MYQANANLPPTKHLVLLVARAALLVVNAPEGGMQREAAAAHPPRSYSRSKYRSGSHRRDLWGPIGRSSDAAPRFWRDAGSFSLWLLNRTVRVGATPTRTNAVTGGALRAIPHHDAAAGYQRSGSVPPVAKAGAT